MAINKKQFIEWFGWYGTAAILLSYALISLQVITAGPLYLLLTTTGAIGLAWVSYLKGAQQATVLNTVYAIIGMIGLIKILL